MMRKSRALPFAAVVLCLASTLGVAAQRTFVGATGTDNPNCSLPAPCRTFTAAIVATSPGGEIIVLDSAGYGPVTITKSVSIITPPGIYAGISVLSGNGVTINAPGATVVLRGLTINGQGGANGILSQAAARVRIESCVVSDMGAVGIYHQAANGEMIVLDTIVRDNGDGGIALVAANASIILEHVRSEHNQNVGLYAAPVPGAIFVQVTITDSLFATNGSNGIWADSVGSAGTYVTVERTTVTDNRSDGISATSGAASSFVSLIVTRSVFSGNDGFGVRALGILPGQVFSHVSANSVGNTIDAIGSGSQMTASGNMGIQGLQCANGATLRSYGDNHVSGVGVFSCTYSVVGSF